MKTMKLVGWEINVPFQHKNRLYRWHGLGWRFRPARLRMANNTYICTYIHICL